jgi:lipopolysaccharide biosynthesis regulator YciM
MNAAWLLLLLPLAATSGWWFASRRTHDRDKASLNFDQSCLIGINHVLAAEDDEALSSFLDTMDQQPKSVELQMVLGSLCRRKGEYERASLIHQAILNNSSHSANTREQAQFELAQDYQAAGWLDRSENLYVELLDSERFQRDTAINLIRIYHQEKDWENAVQTGNFLRDLGLDSDSLSEQLTHFYCELCEQSIRAGRFPAAEEYLAQAEQIEPTNPRVIILLGRMASFKGNHQAAIAVWKKLELIAPAFLGLAMPNIQDSFLVLQDEKGYLEFLKQATKSTQAPEILSALLDTLKVENPQSISRFLVQYLKDKPNIEGLKQILSNWKEIPTQISHEELLFLVETMAELVQRGGRYQCGGCGFKAESFEWSCPSCNKWGKYKRNMLNLPTPPAISSSSFPDRTDVELQPKANHTA